MLILIFSFFYFFFFFSILFFYSVFVWMLCMAMHRKRPLCVVLHIKNCNSVWVDVCVLRLKCRITNSTSICMVFRCLRSASFSDHRRHICIVRVCMCMLATEWVNIFLYVYIKPVLLYDVYYSPSKNIQHYSV